MSPAFMSTVGSTVLVAVRNSSNVGDGMYSLKVKKNDSSGGVILI